MYKNINVLIIDKPVYLSKHNNTCLIIILVIKWN